MSRSNSANAATTQESTAIETKPKPRPDDPVFGYDARGRSHRYDRRAETVTVTRDGEICYVYDVAPDEMDEWIAYVEANAAGPTTDGWLDQWFHDDWADVPASRHSAAKARAADIAYELAKDEGGEN